MAAEPSVVTANRSVLSELPFSDRQDFEDANRGFIATTVDTANPDRYKFLQQDAPSTVNPSLWRQAQLDAISGLFRVADGVYQIRDFSVSSMTIVEGKTGGLHIVDWKTGLPRPHDVNAAQLAIYGLFVQQKFGMALEQMTAHLVYVAAGEHRAQNVVEGEPEARRVIATFVADVASRLTDRERNIAGDRDRFPMTTNLAICRSCNFRELCGRVDETAVIPAPDEDS
jgi:alkyl sulfatase BDS1-like metallo-beta-lactamase superfamily hydrolase